MPDPLKQIRTPVRRQLREQFCSCNCNFVRLLNIGKISEVTPKSLYLLNVVHKLSSRELESYNISTGLYKFTRNRSQQSDPTQQLAWASTIKADLTIIHITKRNQPNLSFEHQIDATTQFVGAKQALTWTKAKLLRSEQPLMQLILVEEGEGWLRF